MKISNEKGSALERAVHAIEEVILASSPDLREKPFRFERNKIITIKGVRQEIDIYVAVEIAKGYDATFIFECKNWTKPVGKNEIIVFSEKIDVAVAQRGYFVATSFSKHAKARAKQDPRITLLIATEHDPALITAKEIFQCTEPAGCNKISSLFRIMGTPGTNEVPLNVKGKSAQIYGKEVVLEDYLNAWTNLLYEQHLLTFQTASLPEGVHLMPASDEQVFAAGECIIDGKEMEYARLEVEFAVKIANLTVVSDFEVATRGRVLRINPFRVRGILINPVIVRLPDEA